MASPAGRGKGFDHERFSIAHASQRHGRNRTHCGLGVFEPQSQRGRRQNNQPAFCPDPVRQIVNEPIPVGYRIRLDVTGRDVDQHDTNGVSDGEGIVFIYSDPAVVDEHIMTNWQRKLTILKPGKWEVYAVFDDVASNSLGFTFVQ